MWEVCYVYFDLNFTSISTSTLRLFRPQLYVYFYLNFTSNWKMKAPGRKKMESAPEQNIFPDKNISGAGGVRQIYLI